MATIPTLPAATYKMDTMFTTSWFEMQKKAIDNILTANVFSAALKSNGCFTKQTGGRHIERTLRYGTKTAIAVQKGDTLPTGEDEIETAALWDLKTLTVHVQRSLQDDQANSGPAARKSLVETKLSAARDALEAKFEAALLADVDTTDSRTDNRAVEDPYSIGNIIPVTTAGTLGVPSCIYTGQTVGDYTYGNVDTGTVNTWWTHIGQTANAPFLMNMLTDMRTLYNYCTKGSSDHPNLILMVQAQYEAYEDLCATNIQLVQDVGSPLAKLGYDVMKFKGAQIIWDPSATWRAATIGMLNTDHLEVVYDPGLWFQMTPWMFLENQFERIARIICSFSGLICTQLRRQGCTGEYGS